MSGYASFIEASYLMTVEDVFNCVELSLVHAENERRNYMVSKRKTDGLKRRKR